MFITKSYNGLYPETIKRQLDADPEEFEAVRHKITEMITLSELFIDQYGCHNYDIIHAVNRGIALNSAQLSDLIEGISDSKFIITYVLFPFNFGNFNAVCVTDHMSGGTTYYASGLPTKQMPIGTHKGVELLRPFVKDPNSGEYVKPFELCEGDYHNWLDECKELDDLLLKGILRIKVPFDYNAPSYYKGGNTGD